MLVTRKSGFLRRRGGGRLLVPVEIKALKLARRIDLVDEHPQRHSSAGLLGEVANDPILFIR